MGIRRTLLRWLAKESGAAGIWSLQGHYRDAVSLDPESALRKVAFVYRAVHSISRNVQQIPVYAVRKFARVGRGRGRSERLADNHPLSSLLLRPNGEEDFSALIEAIAIQLNIRGEALMEMASNRVSSPRARPSELFVHPSKWLREIKVDNRGRYELFSLRGRADEFKLTGDEAIFFKFYNPSNPWRGLAPLDAAWQAADMHYAQQLFNARFFDRGAVPTLALKLGQDAGYGPLTADQRDRLREEVSIVHGGLDNAHRIAVLGFGESLEKVGESVKDMDFEKLARFSEREILAVYGVPPILAGIVEDANRANSQEQRRLFWEETLIPLAEDIASLLNHKLTPRFGENLQIVFDYSQVPGMRKDMKMVSDALTPLIFAGVLTINEAREEWLDKPPVPWGDQWWHGGQDVPTGEPDADADEVRGSISHAVAGRLVKEWKNATLSRVREGARSPLEAFPPGREAQKASHKFQIPKAAAWQLAHAAYTELSLHWDEANAAEAIANLFDELLQGITKDAGSEYSNTETKKNVNS